MLFDPEVYPRPDDFIPERFLSPDGKTHGTTIRDPHSIVFGFGRRMCPGLHIATAELFLAAASILATFELSKAKDEEGNVIEPSLGVSAGVALLYVHLGGSGQEVLQLLTCYIPSQPSPAIQMCYQASEQKGRGPGPFRCCSI